MSPIQSTDWIGLSMISNSGTPGNPGTPGGGGAKTPSRPPITHEEEEIMANLLRAGEAAVKSDVTTEKAAPTPVIQRELLKALDDLEFD